MCKRCQDARIRANGHGPNYFHLSEELKELTGNYPEALSPEDRELVDLMDQLIVRGHEGFVGAFENQALEVWRKHPDYIYCVCEDHFVAEGVMLAPEKARRLTRLAPILIEERPKPEVFGYLIEASRCFVHGFFQATIALSRSALESGLNDRLEKSLGRTPSVDLAEKINQAARFKFLSPEIAVQANQVRAMANKVLHKTTASEEQAFDSLIQVRAVLRETYGN